jgi:hypothetical protein
VALSVAILPLSPARAAEREPVDIATVPAVPGFPVILDGERQVTDSHGIAHFTPRRSAGLQDRLTFTELRKATPGNGEVHYIARRLYKGHQGPQLTLDVSWQVRPSFHDLHGSPIDPAQIQSMTVKSSTGALRTLSPTEPSELQGQRVIPLNGTLQVKEIYWTIQEVRYAGTSVVNASQQRFSPARTQQVPIQLLFYDVHVHIRDGFFHWGQGTAVALTYPDGTTRRFPLDDTHSAELTGLPRGDYSIRIDGAGLPMTRPLSISHNQDVELKFYTYLDVALAVAVILLLALGLPLVGIRRRRAATGTAPVQVDLREIQEAVRIEPEEVADLREQPMPSAPGSRTPSDPGRPPASTNPDAPVEEGQE